MDKESDPWIIEANDRLQQYVSERGLAIPNDLLHLIANVDWAVRNSQSGRQP